MTDTKTDAVEATEVHDDELDHAVGGRMPTPTAPKGKPKAGDPCAGGE